MNKVYSLRYSYITCGYIAVSEICRGIKKSGRSPLRRILALLLLGGLAVPESYASIVSDEIPYSVFRDFAENKGVFQPGATDIAIYDKSGAKVGTLDLAPFPDFSSASTNTGFATLIAPQFIAGVAHNGGYTAVSFGYGNNYRLLDRNNHPDFDFHVPRLNKIVTEVVPIPMTTAGIAPGTYQNIDRFPVFYHIGSGVQYTKARGGALHRLSGSYQYLTGGTIGRPSISDTSIVSGPGDTFNPAYGPLANYSAPGDSGSPLYGYDAQEGRWVLVAVTRAYAGESGTTNWWVVVPVGFVQAEMAKYSDPAVTFQAGEGALHWTYDNSTNLGTLSQQGNSTAFTMHGQAGTDPNAGKSLTFTSDSGTTQGEIILESSINQGAGVLTFDADYAVRAQDQQTWMGGGLIISADKTLDWQVNGVSNDNLHRLGEGTLHINGQGVNPGGLNVGDGLTLLDQRPDAAGHVQAFSSLNIASGRPTVKLMADGQIDPDSISWGFRGGVLDLNGHDMAFQMLRMADYGARVANSADARAQLSLNYQPLNYLSAEAYPLQSWTDARVGTPGDLYRYENRRTNTVDYFLLNTSGNYGYFPTNQTSNGPWTYLGHDEAGARQTLMLNEQRRNQIIHGQFSDNLDIVNIAEPGMTGTTVFDGSMAITGDFSQRGGSLQFQGHPVTHARDFSTGRPPVSADQPDWEARSFALNTLMLTQADFSLARNAVLLGDIQADASRVILNSNRVFVDSRDGEGVTSADTDVSEGQLSAEVVARSEHQGNILLENRSILAAGGLLSGAVTAANSLVALMADSEHTGDIATGDSLLWLAPGAEQQGDIRLDNAASLTSQGLTEGLLSADASTITLDNGSFQLGDLQLSGASDLTSLGEIVGSLSADASNALLERGSQLQGDITLAGNAALTSRGQTRGLLSADASAIILENGAVQQGDLQLGGASDLTSLGRIVGSLSADASTVLLEWGSRLQGDITLTDSAMLTSQGEIEGRLRADASSALLAQRSLHRDGDIGLSNGATLALAGRNQSAIGAEASLLALRYDALQRGDIALSQSLLVSWGLIYGTLSLNNSGAYFGPASQHKGDLSLLGDDAWLVLQQGGLLRGDVTLTDGAMLTSRGQIMGTLSADASTVTLENGAEQQGDIHLGNGASLTSQGLTEGLLRADASTIMLESGAEQQGDIRLGNGASLTSQGLTEGLLSADASTITLESGAAQQGETRLDNGASLTSQGRTEGLLSADASIIILENGALQQGEVRLDKGAMLTSQGGIVGNLHADASTLMLEKGAVQLGDLQLGGASDLTSLGEIVGNLSADAGSVLLERGSQLLGDITLAGNAALTSRGETRRLLSADASAITLENGAEQQGDIRLDNGASLTSQGLTEGLLSADASSVTLQTGGRHTGVVTLNNGATLTIQAPVSEVESTDVGGQLRGDVILTAASSLISAGSIDGKLRAANSSLYLQQGSLHQGDIALSDGATLALNGRNQGAIDAEASLLTLGRSAGQMGDVALSQSLLISEGRSQGAVSLSDSGAYFGQDSQHWGNLSLEGSNARLALLPGAMLQGDLSVDGAGLLRFGVPPMPEIAIAATPPAAGPAVYRGRIAAPDARVEMRDTLWRMSGDSTLGSLLADDTLITAADGAFMTLTVDRLHADGALVALRADAEASDRLVINETLSGGNNTVLVNYLEPTLPEGRLNVSLISAPAGSDRESFTVSRQYMGFSEVMPELIVRESDSQLDWVLSGFDVAPDSGREEDAASLLSLNYRNFMAEVQYLDKRQLDLRNDPTDTGVWARVLHGAGSAAENYRDRYLHLQVGADRRYGLGETGDLLAGATFTFTDGRASGDGFSSKSRSLGAGLYATALHPSGMFVDLNAKYVHHSTEYQVSLAGLGERKADNHAWYARADVGYRYGLGEGAFVEPHLELVYGSYSATRFDWRDQGMAVSLAQPGFTPLLATAGVTLGQRFDIGEWQTTLRAGLDYQSELLSTGDTLLRDASGERTIRGERDSRLRYSLGIESRVGDGLQLGLEVERSSLGDYNLDYSVQATLRYRF
ncbi:S6 family peptidase [Edwardsiella ictaluri]|uniref:S6 family peptidase n=1 Tax=Edwardsiella ictaluri TaxID=67780 RepID=UPI001E412FFD|nr:S6 family peptidase [Edwardsiella ictaluri]UYB60519.1 autotransporter outer membrane beta-barrel domain-containing protein [Edwardsiella ictaluri]UYB63747.1 autotransporter outer membrane beta-barrel domain-containing protein [Edwardsiella ictaluri]BEH99340.1 hypothetical protein KH20906_20680 [Edwardsiella ictaluri]BEI02831.1 hypothetical protein KB20921_20920 [Edwardsiella ictaluri]BEI06293.1 hypothetical protein KH201010_20790 [Edwardsiella ictaluri]